MATQKPKVINKFVEPGRSRVACYLLDCEGFVKNYFGSAAEGRKAERYWNDKQRGAGVDRQPYSLCKMAPMTDSEGEKQ